MSNDSCTITRTLGKFHVHPKEPRWIVDDKGRVIGSTDVNRAEEYPVGEQICNARVMACSNEMLDMLQELMEEYDQESLQYEIDQGSEMHKPILKAFKLIEKATSKPIFTNPEGYGDK